jgi:glycolate oxidase
MDWMFAPEDLETMTLVREAFDPAGRANPGKLFPTPRSCGESARRARTVRINVAASPADQPLASPIEVF